jgi:hypothetical protein
VTSLVPSIANIKLGTTSRCMIPCHCFISLLGLAGIHQQQNAALAVHLARSYLHSQTSYQDSGELPESFIAGLMKTKWPGRCQTVDDPQRKKITWYLDGAHTTESLDCCMQWFVSPGVGLQSESVAYVAIAHLHVLMCNISSLLGKKTVYWFSIAQVVALVQLS